MALIDEALVSLTIAKNFLRVDKASADIVEAEYIGLGDGSEDEFSLDNTPIGGSLRLYVNGVLQVEVTDFTISGADITFVSPPTNNYPITASYDKAATADTYEDFDDDLLIEIINAATMKVEQYTGRAFVTRAVTERHIGDGAEILRLYRRPIISITSVSYEKIVRRVGDGTETEFSIGSNTPKASTLTIYKDGVLQTLTTHYTISGTDVTFLSAPADEAEIIFRYEVSMVLNSNYFEQIHIGRLKGSWLQDYTYVVVYSAGYGVLAQVMIDAPQVRLAALLIISDMYENREDKAGNIAITGLGSASYNVPSRAAEILNPLRMEL